MSECNAYQCLSMFVVPLETCATIYIYTLSTGYAVGCPCAHMRPGLSLDAPALQNPLLWALQAACGLVVKHRQTHFQQLRNVQTASW